MMEGGRYDLSFQPDAILTWPTHCDYPLWRCQLSSYRDRVGRVLVTFSEHNVRPDISEFVRKQLVPLDVTFIGPVAGDGDWRDRAVNAALNLSDSDWVWFTEQDLLLYDVERFWQTVSLRAHAYSSIGSRRDDRWDPACLFVRRDVVEQTSRYFGPEPIDHFYKFGNEVSDISWTSLLDIGHDGFKHLAGLSQNHTLLLQGEYERGIYHPNEFAAYPC